MDELKSLLLNIDDSYDDFVIGVCSYAKKSKKRLNYLLSFIKENNDVTTSNVLEFMLSQPDFYDDEVKTSKKELVVY